MNTPVNFEIGKLLRDNKQNISSSKLMYASNGKLTDAIYDFDEWCFAPTIAEVIMWLYEKHGIWIEVHFWDDAFRMKIVNIVELKVIKGFGIGDSDAFKSPTEVYSEAIKYILINKIIKT